MSLPRSLNEEENDEDEDNVSVVGYENEESAPGDFQVMTDSSEDDNFDELTTSRTSASFVDHDKVRCPLCKRKRGLTCKECLLRGNFTKTCTKSQNSNSRYKSGSIL